MDESLSLVARGQGACGYAIGCEKARSGASPPNLHWGQRPQTRIQFSPETLTVVRASSGCGSGGAAPSGSRAEPWPYFLTPLSRVLEHPHPWAGSRRGVERRWNRRRHRHRVTRFGRLGPVQQIQFPQRKAERQDKSKCAFEQNHRRGAHATSLSDPAPWPRRVRRHNLYTSLPAESPMQNGHEPATWPATDRSWASCP
jgi:hypothetical protein